MKKNVRNALAISGLAIVLGTSGIILDANASSFNEKTSRFERNLKEKTTTKTEFFQRHRKIVTGIVSSLTEDSLTITRGEKTFTLTISPTTRIFNQAWEKIAFSDLKIGDQLKVAGTLSGSSIAARTIRDISF